MKRILFRVIVLTVLLTGFLYNNTMAEEKTELFSKEVMNLKAVVELDKLFLSWELKDISDVATVEILLKESTSQKYRKSAEVKPEVNKFEKKVPIFISLDFMVRVISKDGKISNGVEVLKVVGKHKSVILDSCEGRNMQIYLPPSYNSSDKKYPVAYIHDGQNLFVKSTAPVNGYWKVYDTMEELIKTGKVEEMIVVGIYNSSNRTEEYVPYDSEEALNGSKSMAKDYAAFVVNKIIPYVDGKYRTIPNRENRAVMGSSYGGIFSMWMIQHYNEVFSMAAPMSPSLDVGHGEIGREILKEDKKSMKLWLDMGSLEWWRMGLFLEILEKKGYEYGKDFVFLEGYGDMHNEPAWAKRISNAFIMFKGKEAKEIKNIKFDIEAVRGWYGDKWDNPKWEEGNYFVLNPVIEMDNGMKYSLNRFAKYELVNKDDGTIDVEGVFTFKSNKNLEVKVTYKNIEEKVVISYEEMQKKMKEIKE